MRTNKRLHQKEKELAETNKTIANLSNELEQKQRIVQELKKQNKEYHTIEEEMEQVKDFLKQERINRIERSDIRNKLLDLINKNRINTVQSLIDDKLWLEIESEIMSVYPKFHEQIKNRFPKVNSCDIRYCCLCLFNFDTNQEAILLGITIGAIKKRRQRLRKKNSALAKETTLYSYLVNEALN